MATRISRSESFWLPAVEPLDARGVFSVLPRFFRTESFWLSAFFGLFFSLSIALLGGIALSFTERAIHTEIIHRSETVLSRVRFYYRTEGLERTMLFVEHHGINNPDFIVLQKDGRKISGNMPYMSPVSGEREIHGSPRTGTVLGVGANIAPGIFAFSGVRTEYFREVRALIINALIWILGGTIILGPLGGFILSRRFLHRVDAITRVCQDIRVGHLAPRIPIKADQIPQQGDQNELDALAVSINMMLDHIAGLMENLRQVSSDVAHDLRTPLFHLRYGIERAINEATTVREYDAALRETLTEADNILSLFSAILRLAEIEGGQARTQLLPLDLSELIDQGIDIYRAVAEDSGHTLRADMPHTCRTCADRNLLFQLLSNLIENAIIHTPRGTHIVVSGRKNGNMLEISVRDDGPGVPLEDREKIFRRFYRRDVSRTKPGNGLGLALVAAIAEAHNGAVRVQSPETGSGIEFVISLPFAEDAATALTTPWTGSQSRSAAVHMP